MGFIQTAKYLCKYIAVFCKYQDNSNILKVIISDIRHIQPPFNNSEAGARSNNSCKMIFPSLNIQTAGYPQAAVSGGLRNGLNKRTLHMKTVKNFFVLTSTAAALLAPGMAAAETKTADFHVTIRIKPICEVVTNTGGAPTVEDSTPSAGADIDFGEYFSNHTTDVDGQSKAGGSEGIAVKCTKGTPYQIALTPATDNNNAGGGSMNGLSGSGAAGSKIAYTLYQDSGRSKVWGDQSGTNTVSAIGEGFAQNVNYPVYGRVAGSEFDKPVGRYTDKVTVSVIY